MYSHLHTQAGQRSEIKASFLHCGVSVVPVNSRDNIWSFQMYPNDDQDWRQTFAGFLHHQWKPNADVLVRQSTKRWNV